MAFSLMDYQFNAEKLVGIQKNKKTDKNQTASQKKTSLNADSDSFSQAYPTRSDDIDIRD